jgi:hypothetical protein
LHLRVDIGGHRAGTGRNFDGLIDEVALWSRALTAEEISALHHDGSPPALPTEVSVTDTDGDTLEDWWEGLHNLDASDPADALADDDGDAVPAWLERAAGTHPQHDDSPLYDYLREMVSPGSMSRAMVFRHPSQGSLSLRLTGEGSGDLGVWSRLLPDSEIAGNVFGSEFLFSVPAAPPAPWFFRLETDP